ncbi:hypothetical protein B0H16DRAFT_1712969 [Mycena metata]|uniref:Uncharacterized protein n=1 Tax=Mycena metata TaxID=1033252 RepID=A0AAD7JZU9_9AGAR|nr:hypothetical protein B0H16DRAFT_1712969 [Mycena metata]
MPRCCSIPLWADIKTLDDNPSVLPVSPVAAAASRFGPGTLPLPHVPAASHPTLSTPAAAVNPTAAPLPVAPNGAQPLRRVEMVDWHETLSIVTVHTYILTTLPTPFPRLPQSFPPSFSTFPTPYRARRPSPTVAVEHGPRPSLDTSTACSSRHACRRGLRRFPTSPLYHLMCYPSPVPNTLSPFQCLLLTAL